MPRPRLEFWYEFASTYSYLGAMRIEALADAAGVAVRWRPFLLGPVFAAQGWTTSPFNLYAAKGKNMWRDVQREPARLALPPVTRPAQFPPNSPRPVPVAILAQDQPWLVPFPQAVLTATSAEGRSNAAIAARMFVTEKAVGKHTNAIFTKLDLPVSEDDNRRVLAVLKYLDG